jgi:hypothetical protein
MSVAAAVRRAKEKDADAFCPNRRCLWRVRQRDGSRVPCPKHMPKPPIVERLLRFSIERFTDEKVIAMTTASEIWKVTEAGQPAHFVAIGEDGRAVCTTLHLDTSGCADAIEAVHAERRNTSLTGTK